MKVVSAVFLLSLTGSASARSTKVTDALVASRRVRGQAPRKQRSLKMDMGMMSPAPAPTAPISICEDQPFVYCGAAGGFSPEESTKQGCWTLDNIAYCRCLIQPPGDSITLTLETPEGDVCSIIQQGTDNGFGVSTYFTYSEFLKPDGDLASYTCPEGSTGAYAQCDGAICFDSTIGVTFPYFGDLGTDEIICSCPITYPGDKGHPFQFAGPYRTRASPPLDCVEEVFEEFCTSEYNQAGMIENGSIIPVGAAPGSATFLSTVLDGSPPDLNTCRQKKGMMIRKQGW